MTLRRLTAGAAMLCALCMNLSAQNVTDVAVRFLNEYAGNPSDVLAHCSVKPGMKFAPEALQEAISADVKTLNATGWYTDVSSEIEELANGNARVVYVILRRYTLVSPPTITGNKEIKASRIREWLDLPAGARVDEAILFTRGIKVRDEYHKRFHPAADISYNLKPVNLAIGTAALEVKITEGPRRKYSDFAFRGNRAIASSDLAAPFSQYPWYDPRGWFSTTPYSETMLEAARVKALELYLNEGFLDAEIKGPEIVPLGDEKVRLLYTVSEGVRYTVESVAVEGATLFANDILAREAKLKNGTVAGRETLDAAAKRVRDYYASRGYVDVGLRPVVESPVEGRARVRFLVRDDGIRQIRVRKIEISGNTKTQKKVLLREITLSPGDIMDATKVELGENRLRNLNYFETVNAYYKKVDGSDTERDLVYEVVEKRTGQFMIGVGFSSVDNIIGFAEVSQSNFDITNWKTFTGAGQRARASIELGTSTQTYLLQWQEPWFLNRPLSLTIDLYRRQRGYREYDDVRSGGGAELSYAVGYTASDGTKLSLGRLGYRATLEQVEMKSVSKASYDYLGEEYLYTDEPSGYFRSALRVFWGKDGRDRVFVPTRGYQWQLWSEVGSGEVSTFAAGANAGAWFPMSALDFKPVKGHVWSLRGRLESIDGLGETPPITERYFLGGFGTVRGVAYRSLGPKAQHDDRGSWHPIGGQTLTFASTEYSIPLIKAVRLGLFSDFGSLGADSFTADFSEYMLTAGAGLRLDIPGFPVRLDFATPVVNNDENAKKEVFSFSIRYE